MEQKDLPQIPKGKRVLLSIPLGLFVLIGLLRIVIFLPPVQSWIVMKAKVLLENRLGTEVQIRKIDFALPARAELQGLLIHDPAGDTLIQAESFKVNLFDLSLWNLLFKKEEVQSFTLGSVSLEGLDLNLYRRAVDSAFNYQFILDSLQGSDTSGQTLSFRLEIQEILVERSRVRYRDFTNPTVNQFDGPHINWRNLDLQQVGLVSSFFVDEYLQIRLNVKELSLEEAHSGLPIQHLASRIEIYPPDTLNPEGMIRSPSFKIFSGETRLTGKIELPGSKLRTLLDPLFDETFRLELERSTLDMKTVNFFAPRDLPIQGVWDIGGICEGSLAELYLQNISLGFGDSTYANVSGWMTQLTQPSAAGMNLRIPFGYIEVAELKEVLPGFSSSPVLEQLRRMQVSGTLKGGYYDFEYIGGLKTNVGRVQTNLHLTLPPVSNMITYSGKLTTYGLNVDALLSGTSQFSDILNFDGTIKGKGTDLATMDAEINADILQSNLLGYHLDSLHANVKVAKNYLEGLVYGDDGEGVVDLNLFLDLRTTPAKYVAKGTLDRFNLLKYGLYTSQDIQVSSTIDVEFEGDSIEALIGEAKLQSSLLTRVSDGGQLNIPDLVLSSVKRTDEKYIKFHSSLFDIDLIGTYALKRLIPMSQRLFQESRLFFENNDSLIQEYYQTKVADATDTNLRFGLTARDSLNQIFAFLAEPYYISPGTHLEGEFTFGRFEEANISLSEVDSVLSPQGRFFQPSASINLFKNGMDNKLLFAGQLLMDSLKVGPQFDLSVINLNLQGSQDLFYSDLQARQGQGENEIKLLVETSFLPDGKIVSEIDSSLSLLVFQQDSLFFSKRASLTVDQKEYDIRNFMIEDRGSRYIRVDGLIADSARTPLRVGVGDISLSLLDEFYPLLYQPNGLLSVDMELYNLLSDPRIQGNSRIDSFTLDDFYYGNISSRLKWDPIQKKLQLHASLWQNKKMGMIPDSTLTLEGHYSFLEGEDTVAFNFQTQEDFPLNFVYPFVKTQLYGLEGKVELKAFELYGPLSDLVVNGTGKFKDAKFGLDYFQTDYRFNGEIVFNQNNINFPLLKLRDKYEQQANLHGTIRHRGLREFDFSLQLDEMKNFLIMDTKKGDNDLFYGKVFIRNGIADISGDLNKLVVTAFGTSGKGSSLRIPISDFNQFERPDFVHFVGEEALLESKSQTGLKGFELNLTAQVTEDIEIEMIFDEQVGDIMKGRGAGTLTMEINEDGEFFMNGDYEITEGDYLFTAQSIVNKRFEVKPGGKLVWTGDPYSAQMNIEAIYPIQADIKDLLSLPDSRRIPVNVLMALEGELLAPEIALAIELPNVNNSYSSDILNAIKSFEYDEQELNKQVFSLMVFRRFAPIGGFGDNLAGTGLTSSISELLSNQFNYWLSQATTDRLSVNIGTSNFQDMSLLVSYKLFNDRVTLERDGTLISSTSSNSQLSVGNLRMIIKLLPPPNSTQANLQNSELVVEVFNRETLDSGRATEIQSSNQTGIGIFYKRDFDSLQELLKKAKEPTTPLPADG